jgi:hypothetical protein
MSRALWFVALFGCSEYHFSEDSEAPFQAEEEEGEPLPVEEIPEVPVAEAPVYANTSGTLFEVEPFDGTKSAVGDFHTASGEPVDGMVDIAINLEGELFGGTFDALYQINPVTAEVEKICDTDIEMTALTFTDEGALISGGDDRITEVDTEYCVETVVLDNAPYETSGDLVGLPDGFLYWTVRGENSDELVRVDPNTGLHGWIGEIKAEGLFGLGYDDGELYGFSKTGEIVRINPTGAATKLLSADETTPWWGAATNPVVWGE